MTGEAQGGKSLFAVKDAPQVQKQILEEVRRVNTERRVV